MGLGQRLLAAQPQPGGGGLLAVDVAEHHGDALGRAIGGDVGRQGRLATSTFAIDDGDDRHERTSGDVNLMHRRRMYRNYTTEEPGR